MIAMKDKQTYQQEASLCIEQVMEKLKINFALQTEPQMIATILRDDMLLDDFDPIKTLLNSKLINPVPLNPMLEKIRTGIVDKHPAIVEFLCAAMKEDLIQVDENTEELVKRTIHNIYLLNILTKEMFDNWQFMVELRAHFLKKREQLGINSDLLRSFVDVFKITGGLFFSVKTVTMDWVFQEYERIRRQGFIEEKDVQERKMGLTLNILEAVLTDKRQGLRNNALTGVALILTPPEDVRLLSENRALEYLLSPEWTSLYETWNLAFISGNMDNLDLLYPKLLIPQVLNAQSNKYLFNRALSLWGAINFYLFRKAKQHPDVILPNHEEIAQLWGELNYKYAQEYVIQENRLSQMSTGQQKKNIESDNVSSRQREMNTDDLLLACLKNIESREETEVKKIIDEISS